MKVYIAASFKSRDRIRPIRDKIWSLGHQVLSTWLDEVAKADYMSPSEFRRKLAIKDLCEVSAADVIIVDCLESSGGKNFEAGFAFAGYHNKLFWTVGTHTNIFQELADRHFNEWQDCYDYLEKFHYSSNRHTDAMSTP